MTRMTVAAPPAAAQLLTVKDTQGRLRVGRTKVFELVAAGDLEAVRLGTRTTRIVESSVEDYIGRLRNGLP